MCGRAPPVCRFSLREVSVTLAVSDRVVVSRVTRRPECLWQWVRPRILIEQLEARRHLSLNPIEATVGVPLVNVVVADAITIPANATSLQHFNVLFGSEWDYDATLVPNGDGTYKVLADVTFGRSGESTVLLYYRNNKTGGWDVLDTGVANVAAGKFTHHSQGPFYSGLAMMAGTVYEQQLVTFEPEAGVDFSSLSLVGQLEIDGEVQPGAVRLVERKDGLVDAYYDGIVTHGSAVLRLFEGSEVVGYAPFYMSAMQSEGFGFFEGTLDVEGTIRVDVSSNYWGDPWKPAGERTGWDFDLTARFRWDDGSDYTEEPWGEATVEKDAAGRWIATIPRPEGLSNKYWFGMIFISETLHRPAGQIWNAEDVALQYVGTVEPKNRNAPTPVPPPVSSEDPTPAEEPAVTDDPGETPTVRSGGAVFAAAIRTIDFNSTPQAVDIVRPGNIGVLGSFADDETADAVIEL